ncbi:hypothetical protein Adt_21592 [Abeliophyllum distichum]|uniref:Uncharacterized protein n=1 Tax=Abeliophyllum distichum TaxID=126358 RepID=A0ABD1SZT3_9LAMI
MWTEVRQLGFVVSGPLAMCHLIGTLPDEWQDVAKIVYNLLWTSSIPILPREIDYEAFCIELTELYEEVRDDALEFSRQKIVPPKMRIGKDALSPISDIEE